MEIEQVKLFVGIIVSVTIILLAAVGVPAVRRDLKRRKDLLEAQLPEPPASLPEEPGPRGNWFKRYRNTALVGLFLVFLFTGLYFIAQITLNRTEPAQAVVTKVVTEKRSDSSTKTYQVATVAFNVENKRREAEISHPVQNWVVGEIVEIRYNPDYPSFVSLRDKVEGAAWNRSMSGRLLVTAACVVFAAAFLSVAVASDKKRVLRKKQPQSPKKGNYKNWKLFKRWKVPLLLTVLCVVWQAAACGVQISLVAKCMFGYVGIGIFYNWLMSWMKDKPGQKPPTIELVLALPIFLMLLFFTVPPFPYVRPWILTAAFALAGFEGWAVGLGYLVQEKGLQKTCTVQATAVVLGNIEGRVSNGNRPGKISAPTYFPVLAYDVQGERIERKYDHGQPRPMEVDRRIEICYDPQKPEEFCFAQQKENKALTLGVPFLFFIGTIFFVVAVLSVKFKLHF